MEGSMPRTRKVAATPPADVTVASATVSLDTLPAHSPQGGSVAEQFINCQGSKALRKRLLELQASGQIEVYDNDPEYRRDGVMAHEMASVCLKNDEDAWEQMDGFPLIEPVGVVALQAYLDYVRQQRANPFKGIEIIDLKFGEGIVVEPEENPQIMYYGFGFLEGKVDPDAVYETMDNGWGFYVERRVHLPEFHPDFFGTVDAAVVLLPQGEMTGDYHDDMPVRLTIVQPRVTWHPAGPVRSWDTTAGAIRKWANEILLPAMRDDSLTFKLGEHCRFCPAVGRNCPAMRQAVDEVVAAENENSLSAEGHDEAIGIADMTEAQMAHYRGRHSAVKMFYKALDERIFRILSAGGSHPELAEAVKLVNKITYRIWKPGEEKKIVRRLGKENAYTKPELISPAAAEKLIEHDGKAVVAEFATTPPPNGLTLAPIDDPRPAVVIQSIEEKFPIAPPAELW
jgi:hypothetical protein